MWQTCCDQRDDDEMTQEETLRKCANDLEFFGRTISQSSFTLKSPPFHKKITSLLMNTSIPQLMIEAPRGCAKSTLTRLYVMHHYIFEPGDKVIVIQSKTLREAKRRLWKIKDTIEYNESYRELFGYHGEQVADSWREDYIKFKFNGSWVTIIPAGTGQQIRGLLEGDTRLTLYLLDDPDDEENTKTIERTEDNFSKFLGGVACLDRISNGRVIVIGTPIGEGCIVARLRDSHGWVTVRFAAVDEDTKECLWEDMYSYEWLMEKKKELDEQGMLWKFYSEYQCELKGKDDQIFKNENFVWWDGELIKGKGHEHILHVTDWAEWDEKTKDYTWIKKDYFLPALTFQGVDPAFSLNPKADYSVILNQAVTPNYYYYVLPFIRKRMLDSELKDTIKSEYLKYKATKTKIENVGAQDSIRQSLSIDEMYIPGLSIRPAVERTKKIKRYTDKLEEPHRKKRIILHRSCLILKQEMVMCPSLSGHDDTIDGLYLAIVGSYPPEHTIPTEEDRQKEMDEEELKYFLRGKSQLTAWSR
jgi:hypothetical protein